jgi:hypothetical protein
MGIHYLLLVAVLGATTREKESDIAPLVAGRWSLVAIHFIIISVSPWHHLVPFPDQMLATCIFCTRPGQ